MGYFRASTARLEFWWLAHTVDDCRVEAYGQGAECEAVRKSLADLRDYMQVSESSSPLSDVLWESFLAIIRLLIERDKPVDKIIFYFEGEGERLELFGVDQETPEWPEEEYQILLRWFPVLLQAYGLLMQETPTTITGNPLDAIQLTRRREQDPELD